MVTFAFAVLAWALGLLTADWVGERTRRKHAIAQDEARQGGLITW